MLGFMRVHAQDPSYPAAPASPQNIVAAESFVDTDPGIGKALSISVSAATDISNLASVVNLTGLSNGMHRLYIRTKNAEAAWSITQTRDFLYDFDPVYAITPPAAQNIIAAEYFIDTDPGYGHATAIVLTAGIDISNASVVVNTTGLSTGTHRLYIRTRNTEGGWAICQVKDFLVDFDAPYANTPAAAANIVAAEYFIDTDPGFGKAVPVAITPATELSGIVASVNTGSLPLGIHRIYIRTLNQEGRWSLGQSSDFLVNNDFAYPAAPAPAQNIVAAEYFVDTDPGIGSANAIPVTAATDISNLTTAVNTASLGGGTHRLYIRTKNQEGRWSLVATDTFATGYIRLSADTLGFGQVIIGSNPSLNLVVTNTSGSVQTINAVTTHAPFSTNFSPTVSIPAGQSVTLPVTFAPTAVQAYNDSILFTTSGGNFRVVVNGSGIAAVSSWAIDPANGYNFGNVPVGNNSNYSFVIRNTGNTSVVLGGVTSTDPAFVPTFTAGTTIAPGATVNLPVQFTPPSVGVYSAQLKISASSGSVPDVTTVVTGNGYTPGTAPVLQFVTALPYSGTGGVHPAAGQAGLFTYKVLYQSANNLAPRAGNPQVGIDLNGDGDFNDLNEGVFAMTKEGSSNDYATGVVYAYTFNHTVNTTTAGYQFFAADVNGNNATATAYTNGPVVTDQQPDLRIFASDISFSKANPQPGELFTMTARVSNASAVPVSNVPVKFYRDTILIGSAVIPSVNANGSASFTTNLSFGAEGFYPIKVWIDSSNTLGESNVLNNYAIRPVVVGSPNLPGGITVSSTTSLQQCPQLTLLFTGHANYYGTGSPAAVAGATVTINTGSAIITTTTDANGDYRFLWTGVSCGGNLTYTVSVTDYTFTSSLLTAIVSVPCPPANACVAPPSAGGMVVQSTASNPCANLVGGNGQVNFSVQYRERDISNMWSSWDEIVADTLKVFVNGVLSQVYPSADFTHAPGEKIIFPVTVPLTSTAPVVVSGELSYTYVEYRQIPDNFYHGIRTRMLATGSATLVPTADAPDLTISGFTQTGFTSFDFTDANAACGAAGAHTVKVFDSIPGGSNVLLKTYNIGGLSAQTGSVIHFSDTSLSPGTHFIKIVTDADAAVTETDEGNNQFIGSIVVAAPDLAISLISTNPTSLAAGAGTKFTATVKNSGKACGPFAVRFAVNGVQTGGLKLVGGLGEKKSVQVVSDVYTVTGADTACGPVVIATADFNNQVIESSESNNDIQVVLGADLSPYQLPAEQGSSANPVIVRVNTNGQFFPAIRNIGLRDVKDVTVTYILSGTAIGNESIPVVRAGEAFASFGSFSHMFTVPGDYVVSVVTDTANGICEADETNNTGSFYIRVVDSKPDFEVLSQYISPSSLNPNAGQNISIVGTVRNSGGKPTSASVLRFMVDDIQLGNDVPINALQPGADTTVAATASYSSIIAGVKLMKIVADPLNELAEEREDNNVATRALIVGDAPDMAKAQDRSISFNPGGFSAGDSVTVLFAVKNNGVQQGSAWVRFMIYDSSHALTATDSVQFTLAAGGSMTVSKRMLFLTGSGTVIAQIAGCSPAEFDLLNNSDTLAYSTVVRMKKSLVLNAGLDMKAAVQDQLPGWIGGKLILDDYDLTVNGIVTNFDSLHFVVTNGLGRLRLVTPQQDNVFPVGASLGAPNFVRIVNTGVQDNFSVGVYPWVLRNGSSGDSLKSGYVNRTWLIEEDVPGGSNASVTLFWSPADEQAGFNRNLSRVAHYTGNWTTGAAGPADSISSGWYSYTQAGYTHFSPFTITSVSAALPLHLLQFEAAVQVKDILLQWKTSDEVNTDYFQIEHSDDGRSFRSAGVVAAKNVAGLQTYSFLHMNPGAGVHYYRLKMVDKDGSFTYSVIRQLSLGMGGGFNVYPNPAHQFVVVEGAAAGGLVRLYTADGRMLRQFTAGGMPLRVGLQELAAGIYILEYAKDNIRVRRMIMKE